MTESNAAKLVDYLWQEFCELPDRTSPDDYPDTAMVTLPELTAIVETWFERSNVASEGDEACEQAASDALQFVMTRLPAIKKEKGLVGVWMNAWRVAWASGQAIALRTPSDGEVVVKPMKWGATSYGKPEAFTVAGTYRITDAWDGGFNVNRGNVSFQSEDGRRNFSTIEAAKAAAQADYEQRILSALSPGKE